MQILTTPGIVAHPDVLVTHCFGPQRETKLRDLLDPK